MKAIGEPTAPSTPHCLLAVDDDEGVLLTLRDTLTREGYDMITCSDPLQAIQLIEERSFSAILASHQMASISGLELLDRVREVRPDTVRVLLTTVLSLTTVIGFVNKGDIFRFVVKPWLREELLATVRNAVHCYELVCRNKVLEEAAIAMNRRFAGSNQTSEEVGRGPNANCETT